MPDIHFERAAEHGWDVLARITQETLWYPQWPGADAFVRDFQRWPHELQEATLLIYDGGALVGRVVAPQFDDYFIVRDLGLHARRGLAVAVARTLVQRAQTQRARVLRCIVQAPLWSAFAQCGFGLQKRRTTMQLELSRVPSVARRADVRNLRPDDSADIGELMHAAYEGTADDEGEGLDLWIGHTRDVLEGQYGRFISPASFVYPLQVPFASATLLVENAPRTAVVAQVVTRRSEMNRGHARMLLLHSLTALAALDYRRCFLEVTLSNANALHLYRSLGFDPIGPQSVFGLKLLR